MSEGDLFTAPVPTAARFADGKEPDALRTIGEVAQALGLKAHVLRYWEDQFPMLKPLKRSGGRRYYRPEDVALVETIDRLVHREGYTLKGARKALSGRSAAAAPAAPSQVVTTGASATTPPMAIRARLLALRSRLAEALHES